MGPRKAVPREGALNTHARGDLKVPSPLAVPALGRLTLAHAGRPAKLEVIRAIRPAEARTLKEVWCVRCTKIDLPQVEGRERWAPHILPNG